MVYSRAWEEPENFTYQWDFSYSYPFIADETTILNQTTHPFAQEGTYIVAVRVWDSDSYAQSTNTIVIVNSAPVAKFLYQPIQGGQIRFDASLTEDTPSDIPLLQYRWNFHDGTDPTNWSSNPIQLHTFEYDGNYSVVLYVRDNNNDTGTVTDWVLVDRTKPEVSGLIVGEAYVGIPIIIRANISDNLGIESVVLYYRIGNETFSSEMLRVGETSDQYEGQIRSQNSTVTLFFWIKAVDTSGNNYTSSEYELRVVLGPLATEIWLGGLGVAGVVLGGVYVFARRRYATVDEVFVIYEDGCLMAHDTRRLKPGMDDEVLSSMLVAIQSFVKDSFKDEKTTALKRLDFGEKKILVEKWDRVFLAAVLHGKHAGKIPQRMLQVLEGIQRDYGSAIADWDGDLEKVRGVKDMTKPLFKQPLLTDGLSIAVLRVIRRPGRLKEEEVVMTECPVCDQPIPSDARECPSCGAELKNADIGDLEKVAQDMLQERNEPEKPGP